ncbi:MAG: hypothetical protein ACLQVD_01030 [Capsulimonadaceae bacterium]
MKKSVLLRIGFDGHDQDTYNDVAYEVYGADGRAVRERHFGTGDPCRDWSNAIHEALSYRLPVLWDHSCEDFIRCGSHFAWGTTGMKIAMHRVESTAPAASGFYLRSADFS